MIKSLLLVLFILIGLYGSLTSQSSKDASVELSAVVQKEPPRITLNWVPNDSATAHIVYRKLKTGNSWGAVIGNLPGSATQFIDSTVSVGISYEYRVSRQANAFTGNGYINSGIEIPFTDNRGSLILVVDSTFIDSLAFELKRLQDDFEGDGWRVMRIDVSREMPVTLVKTKIKALYTPGTKAVFLVGHVPVPYSGEINVDGHADHTGAYPADVYYAEMNSSWTDAITNNISAGDPRNRNIPEDGKFDQGAIPSDIELQIGRVDFFNLPSFGDSEQELLRAYLNKDHAYRHKEFSVAHRMLIDDNFGYFNGEAFASGGWRNAASLVGPENVMAGNYFPDMATNGFLWSYGCGGGWYQGAGGVGSTSDFAVSDLQTVFTMLFGSYFGDWDTPDNFLRAALAQGKTLTNVWSGRPHWQFHHMGLGENIGYDVRISQNNSTLYQSNFGARLVHMAFMGDPTLRNDIVSPVTDVTATLNDFHANITWTPPVDSMLGYYVYLKNEATGEYVRLNEELLTGTSFIDSCLFITGVHHYMVRAMILQQTPSGTYFNLSQGIVDTLWNDNDPSAIANATYTADEDIISFTNTSSNATSYLWSFGDGETSTEPNPVHDYIDGDFTATLIATNECDADTFYLQISILTSTQDIDSNSIFSIYPNPSSGEFHLSLENNSPVILKVYSLTGKQIFQQNECRENNTINLGVIPDGIYLLSIQQYDRIYNQKLIIQK